MQTLTNKEKCIKVAQACGWTYIPSIGEVPYGYKNNPSFFGERLPAFFGERLPDYCNDLNAMHEAERSLTPELFEAYAFWLSHITPLGKQIAASAEQRAEAFGKTLWLW